MRSEQANFASARVLVVDDEPNIVSLMVATLTGAGIDADAAISGQDALLQLSAGAFDLVVLDINLPDMDGFRLFQMMRERNYMQPVLYVTAREKTTDRIDGLSLGAEDYIVKPFDLDEFVARVHVCLRRLPKFANQSRLTVGPLELDFNSRQVWRSGTEVQLTPTEFSLLSCLMRSAGRAVSRQEIFNEVWFEGYPGQTALLDPFVSNLRKKVDAEEPHMIQTVRGVGYLVRADV